MRLPLLFCALLTVCTLSSPISAKVLHLKTGGEIECQSYRQEGDRVYVTVNPDLEIDFAVDEVDLGRGKPALKRSRHTPVQTDAHSAANAAQVANVEAAKVASSGKRPFFAVPIAKGSTACSPQLQSELLDRYGKYNHAAEIGSFDEFQKHIIRYQAEVTKKALAGLGKSELQQRRTVLLGMAVKDYHATDCMVAPDGGSAALAGRGKSQSEGKFVDSHGTISFKKENGQWKVQTTVWNTSMK